MSKNELIAALQNMVDSNASAEEVKEVVDKYFARAAKEPRPKVTFDPPTVRSAIYLIGRDASISDLLSLLDAPKTRTSQTALRKMLQSMPGITITGRKRGTRYSLTQEDNNA